MHWLQLLCKVLNAYKGDKAPVTDLEYRNALKDVFENRRSFLEEQDYVEEEIKLYEKKLSCLVDHLGL